MPASFDLSHVGSRLRGPGHVVGGTIEFHQRVESTNDRARQLAEEGAPEGSVVAAAEQTVGRGRGGRGWHSPPGLGLYLSIILRPSGSPAGVALIGLLAAVAGAESLSRFTREPVRIKWPNDLILEKDGGTRLKLAGILAEGRTGGEGIRDVILGMGTNVNHELTDFPVELQGRATSLRIESGEVQSLSAVAIALLSALDSWYTIWKRDGAAAVLREYRSLALDLEGRRVRVRQPGLGAWAGTTSGLCDDGSLRVLPDPASHHASPADGKPVAVRYGELTRIEGD